MKRLSFALFIAVMGAVMANAASLLLDSSTFPDANFRKFITEVTGVKEGGKLYSTSTNWLGRPKVDVDHLSDQLDWNLDNRSIKDLTGIEYFSELQILSCKGNELTSLDLRDNTSLYNLHCENNMLTSLNVTGNTLLTSLFCDNNKLKSLNVSKNTKLITLSCFGNMLTTLDVTKCTELTGLSCYNNQLSGTLDVTRNTKLTILYAHKNKISSIDVRNCTSLQNFTVNENQLTSLDVTRNTQLTRLWFDTNNISTIDLSKNTKLANLKTNHNKLTKLDVSKCPLIADLTAAHNEFTEVNVTGLTQLTHFCVNFNDNLKEIKGLSTCTALTELYVNDCDLYTLDVSKLVNLKTLHVQNNHLIQMNATAIRANSLEPYDISYYHNDDHDGYGWGGTKQTRTMPATRENVNADGTGIKEWYVVKMPKGVAVPDGLGGTETFVNNTTQKLNVMDVETEGVITKVVGGETYFYIPVENTPDKFSFTYNVNHKTNKNMGEFSEPNAGGTYKYLGYDGVTEDALLQVIITPTYPTSAFVLGAAYRSTFLPSKKLNSYKNTITLTGVFNQGDYTFDGRTYTIERKAANSEETTDVATVTLHHAGTSGYTYTVEYPASSWSAQTDRTNRWDNEPTVNSGNVTSGITIADYFAVSTANGGDLAGSYTYRVKEDNLANTVIVPVYAAATQANLVSDYNTWKDNTAIVGYTLDEINSAREDHHELSVPKGVAADHSEFYNPVFKYHSLYCNNNLVEKFVIGANGTISLPYYHKITSEEEDYQLNDLTYVYGLHVASPHGENSYGTNEVEIPVASVTSSAYNFIVSEAHFHTNSHYFTCSFDVNLNQWGALTTVGGGYRMWRTCTTADEEHAFVAHRSNDFMFYKNMGLTDHVAELEGVGTEKIDFTREDGNVYTYASGIFGSSSQLPSASYRLRAYYKAAPATASRGISKAEGVTYYYIAEQNLEVVWGATDKVVTGLDGIDCYKQVKSVNYYNHMGQCSNTPFNGVNIIVTTYTDGTTSTAKVIK